MSLCSGGRGPKHQSFGRAFRGVVEKTDDTIITQPRFLRKQWETVILRGAFERPSESHRDGYRVGMTRTAGALTYSQ